MQTSSADSQKVSHFHKKQKILLSQKLTNHDDWRLPKTYAQLIARLGSHFTLDINELGADHADYREFEALMRLNGYKRVRNTLVYINNNFAFNEEIKVRDVILTLEWEKKFRNFLKIIIEDVELAFSNAILNVLINSSLTWKKTFPNIDLDKTFTSNNLKRVRRLLHELRSRFWNHKEEILDLEDGALEKFKMDEIFIWDCFDKASFGDLITFYTSFKDSCQVKAIKYFSGAQSYINARIIANFEEAIKFLKLIRNKIYHNEQLFSNNLVKNFAVFEEIFAPDDDLSPIDKVLFGLAYSLPREWSQKIHEKIMEVQTTSKKYIYITKLRDLTANPKFNLWSERINLI